MAKGQGLALNVIIIAILALLVLTILAVFMIRGGGRFVEGTGSCEVLGGKCAYTKPDYKCGENEAPQLVDECKKEGIDDKGICCITFKKDEKES